MTFYTLVHSGRILPIVETRLPNQHTLRQYKHKVDTFFWRLSYLTSNMLIFCRKGENDKDDDGDGNNGNKAAL